jgi:MinD-like ATPase involved in chromosome partitioning or flagellar assembly
MEAAKPMVLVVGGRDLHQALSALPGLDVHPVAFERYSSFLCALQARTVPVDVRPTVIVCAEAAGGGADLSELLRLAGGFVVVASTTTTINELRASIAQRCEAQGAPVDLAPTGDGDRPVMVANPLVNLRTVLGVAPRPSDATAGHRLPNQISPRTLRARPALPSGHVLCVYGSRGGVGKTTIAVNLAARLSYLGQRVLVIDLDVGGPGLGPHLGLTGATAIDAVNDPPSFAQCLHQAPGFSVLLSPSSDERRRLTPTAYQRMLEAASEFDVVILDCPVRLTDPLVCRFALRAATSLCVVVNNEAVTVDDARRVLDRARVAARVGVLVNQYVDGAGMHRHEIATQFPVIGVIPDDRLAHLGRMLTDQERPDVTAALDSAISALIPELDPLPLAALAHPVDQLARLERDLERRRRPGVLTWLRSGLQQEAEA